MLLALLILLCNLCEYRCCHGPTRAAWPSAVCTTGAVQRPPPASCTPNRRCCWPLAAGLCSSRRRLSPLHQQQQECIPADACGRGGPRAGAGAGAGGGSGGAACGGSSGGVAAGEQVPLPSAADSGEREGVCGRGASCGGDVLLCRLRKGLWLLVQVRSSVCGRGACGVGGGERETCVAEAWGGKGGRGRRAVVPPEELGCMGGEEGGGWVGCC